MTKKTAICMFCEGYSPKERYCYYKQCNIPHHPMKPLNCRRYDGIPLTETQLIQYEAMARESEKVS